MTLTHLIRNESCQRDSSNIITHTDTMPGLDVEKLVRLNQVLGVNLKPNEDGDYAEEPFMPMSPMEALRTGRRCTNIVTDGWDY